MTGDTHRLSQVIRNLLSNAVKFSPKSGTIRVETLRNSETITLRVRDEGSGIPDDELESIFSKFVQSSRTKTGAGGTGLGLAIIRQIVEAHGGQIWAELADVGACFVIELPAADATAVPILACRRGSSATNDLPLASEG